MSPDGRKSLDTYASHFRNLINEKIIPTSTTLRDTLRLNKDSDWDFLCASMDIIDDASKAIDHVQRFGLQGATKYIETGECYLRLYGLLSAAYIQQDAVLKVYKIMNVAGPGDAKKCIDKLEIRSLRHKIAAHSTNYDNDGVPEAHAPVRFKLNNNEIAYSKYGSTPIEKVDLNAAISKHLRCMNYMMDKILEKSIGTLYRGQNKEKKEWLDKLNDLRVGNKGGIVVHANASDGQKIIITFAGSADE